VVVGGHLSLVGLVGFFCDVLTVQQNITKMLGSKFLKGWISY